METLIRNVSSAFKFLFIFTLFLGVPPFLIYAQARWSGALPSEAVWSARGGNHGPWWDSWQALPMALPMLVLGSLAFVSVLIGLFMGAKSKGFAPIIYGLCLAGLQFFIAFLQLVFLFWTVE